jgi:hypothetical protein
LITIIAQKLPQQVQSLSLARPMGTAGERVHRIQGHHLSVQLGEQPLGFAVMQRQRAGLKASREQPAREGVIQHQREQWMAFDYLDSAAGGDQGTGVAGETAGGIDHRPPTTDCASQEIITGTTLRGEWTHRSRAARGAPTEGHTVTIAPDHQRDLPFAPSVEGEKRNRQTGGCRFGERHRALIGSDHGRG